MDEKDPTLLILSFIKSQHITKLITCMIFCKVFMCHHGKIKEIKKFDIKAARERYIFYKEMAQHEKDMNSLKHQFASHRSFPKVDDNDNPEDNLNEAQSEKSASTFKTKMKRLSSQMSTLFKKMELLVQDKNLPDAYSPVKHHISEWIGQVDGYECNLLHMAVEKGNKMLLEALLLASTPVNSIEGCGLTPLMMAININNLDLVKILIW